MSAGRYTLVGASRLILPGDAKVVSGDGVQLSTRLGRQVESEAWETFGDGYAVPQPLVIDWQLEGTSEADASLRATEMWNVCRSITRLERDNRVYRPILAPLGYGIQHIEAEIHRISLTLAPAGPDWLTLREQQPRAH